MRRIALSSFWTTGAWSECNQQPYIIKDYIFEEIQYNNFLP